MSKTVGALVVWVLLGFAGTAFYGNLYSSVQLLKDKAYLSQFNDSGQLYPQLWQSGNSFLVGAAVFIWVGILVALVYRLIKDLQMKNITAIVLCVILAGMSGCARPFEPVQLEVIGTNEEAFLIPLTGNTKDQVSTSSVEYLKNNLVQAKQVRIAQQWVPIGYEWMGPNGNWRPAATLIKVDRSPVTREWTADEKTGTSTSNQAIWVMTSDQVEFSTGWTCTARINDRDDAVKFLSNYPNGSLVKVLDQEVRSQIQTRFGMEVTDLPMEKLRKDATPHLKKVIGDVETFFASRGLTITNLGISGGFIYKDSKIGDKIVEVFNAEQAKTIEIAKSQAQEQANKRIQWEAEGKAKALLTEKKAESDGIKMVADAKSYEIEKAKANLSTYLELKRLELEGQKVKAWDGKFPNYFMGAGNNPNMLLSIPTPTGENK